MVLQIRSSRREDIGERYPRQLKERHPQSPFEPGDEIGDPRLDCEEPTIRPQDSEAEKRPLGEGASPQRQEPAALSRQWLSTMARALQVTFPGLSGGHVRNDTLQPVGTQKMLQRSHLTLAVVLRAQLHQASHQLAGARQGISSQPFVNQRHVGLEGSRPIPFPVS
jgi:hypothetical protein